MSSDTVPVEHDPFGGGDIARLSPSSEPQREVVAAAMLSAAANTAYNEGVSLRLTGPYDAVAIENALRTLVDRHDALRTTFTPELDTLCVTTRNDFRLERIDAASTPASAREQVVGAAWQELVTTPMDLLRGPLFRARLLQFSPVDAELVLMAHHVVCDGWSYHVLLQELAALCSGTTSLPPAPSFAAFAEQVAGRRDAATEAWWLQRFADNPASLDLPTDRPRPAVRTFAAHRVDHRFAPATTRAMAAVAGRLRASVVNVLLGGVAALLHRLCEVEDVVLGMPVARQALADLPGLVGHCVHLLPVRVRLDETTRFGDLVTATRNAVVDATEHFDFTFGSLVRGLGRSGDAARVPLIPVLVNLDQPLADLDLGRAKAAARTVPRTAEGFELFCNVMPSGGEWVVEATFNADLFDDATIAAWLAVLEQLLLAGCADPGAFVGALRLAPPSSPATPCLAMPARALPHAHWLAALAAQAQRQPDAIAVVDGAGTTTYAGLLRAAQALAHELARRGVGRGDLVGVRVGRSRDLVVAIAGVHWAGAAFVPLDPDFPVARQVFQLQDAGVRVLVADGEVPAALAAERLDVLDVRRVPQADAAAPRLPDLDGDDLAYLIYTSGSTGKPKGVRLRHRSLVNLLVSVTERPGMGAADSLLAITTVAFDISLLELLTPLVAGGRVVVASRDEAEDPERLASLLQRHRITVMQATPATWQLLLESQWPGHAGLRAFCGGERLRRDLAAALLPKVASLWNLYGPTETCIWSTVARVDDSERAALVGTPVDNTVVLVLDRGGNVLPPSVPGEICIGGIGVAQGYHNLPNLTAERFLDHAEFGRVYRTGDRGRIRPDGVLECTGRLDQQVKVRGFRIELGEIETVLAEHPAIADAAVAVVDANTVGARIVAYAVARGAEPDAQDLRGALRTRLPEYMVPQQFLWLPALPRLPNGKLDRRALPRPSAPVPTSVVPPATAMERTVVSEMAAVLRIDTLGVEQGFFDAGGHSLLAAQLVARLNRTCGAQLTMRQVFEAPTARLLARLLVEAPTAAHPTRPRIVARAERSRAPATHQQERIWFLQQMVAGNTTYNLPSAHRLRGPFDAALFGRALQAIVDRQSVLRTTFERRDGRLWQVVHDVARVELPPIEDLSALPAADRERRLQERLDGFVSSQFDLAQLPLFRVHLFRLAADEHVFFFMPHHIVWDGWSFDVLYEEMAALLAAFAGGRPNPLPALPIDFGDYSAWHRDLMASAEVAAQVRAWQQRLQAFGPVRPLVPATTRAAGMSGEGVTEHVAIDAERTAALRALGRDHGATLFATMLSVYAVLLHEFSRQRKLLLATPLRGRDQEELESVMGCCNSLLPVILEVEPADTFASLLVRTKALVMDSLAAADATLEAIAQGATGGGFSAGASLLYQALFSFQDVRRRQRHWGPLAHEMVHVFQKGATEDLGLWFVEGERGLQGGIAHNTHSISRATAARLRDRLLELVDAVIRDPAARVGATSAAPATDAGGASNGAVATPAERTTGNVPAVVADAATPDGDLEFLLSRIWCRVLGLPRVGLDDNFFELGGNSLGVIRCATEFEAATGSTLDVGQFFRTPTIAGLVPRIGRSLPRESVLTISLQEGGAGDPLFCLVGISVYRHLASALAGERPVIALYSRGEEVMQGQMVETGTLIDDIQHVADQYAEAICRTSPRRGVYLAGLSVGGVVAMATARGLVERGQPVAGVILLDSILPTGVRRGVLRTLRDSRLGIRLRNALSEWRGRRSTSIQEREEQRRRREHGWKLEHLMREWQARFTAPSWPVCLVRARNMSPWGRGLEFARDLGWRAVVGEGLSIVEADGDHLGILRPPSVLDVAAHLRGFMAAPGATSATNPRRGSDHKARRDLPADG